MTTTYAAEIQMHHATRAKAAKLHDMLAAEYPALTLIAVAGDEIDHETHTHSLQGFKVTAAVAVDRTGDDMQDETDITIYEGEKVPSLAMILDTCAEEDIDPVGDEDEDDARPSGSVVPESYRTAYRTASTTGRSNGDWLAERLAADTLNADGVLIIDDFVAILSANGVDMTGKWAQMRFTQSRGWQGRFRMNGRQVLEKMVAKAGVYIDHTGTEITPHGDWLDITRGKHAKWLAKEAKRDAAAEKAIKEMVEGAA